MLIQFKMENIKVEEIINTNKQIKCPGSIEQLHIKIEQNESPVLETNHPNIKTEILDIQQDFKHEIEEFTKFHMDIEGDEEKESNSNVVECNNIELLETENGRLYYCPVCQKPFKERGKASRHILVHTGEKSFFCHTCKNGFTTKLQLKKHIQKHLDNSEFEPKPLEYELSDDGKKYICLECKKPFKSKYIVKQHILFIHKERKFPCSICNKRFSARSQVKKHLLSHSDAKEFSCEFCNKKFKHKFSVKPHVLVYHSQQLLMAESDESKKAEIVKDLEMLKKMTCNICKEVFTRPANLHRHIRKTHRNRSFNCEECMLQFDDINIFKTHMCHSIGAPTENGKHLVLEENPNDTLYTCEVCHETFTELLKLQKHQEIHEGYKPYPCGVCGQRFRLKIHVKQHEFSHSGIKNHACKICGKTFLTFVNVMNHMSVHSEERNWSCQICDKKFKKKSCVTSHMKTHVRKPKVQCEICNKSLSSQIRLKSHYLTHTNERPFRCTLCEKGFNQQGTLTMHMLTHSGDYPISCAYCRNRFKTDSELKEHFTQNHPNISPTEQTESDPNLTKLKRFKCKFCDKAYRDRYHLKCHELSHSNHRQFACEVCDKRFILKLSLDVHMVTHATESPYSCSSCEKAFKTELRLKAHQITHSSEKKFACLVCDKHFKVKIALKRHLQAVCHKDKLATTSKHLEPVSSKINQEINLEKPPSLEVF